MRLEALDEVRVGEETDVEHQIARGRDAVAEPEAEQGEVELVVLSGPPNFAVMTSRSSCTFMRVVSTI